ncbi:error-prone DNA polymerase [Thiohalocapsa halophila]|uniref:Error-prone DNA polymerase n=1 Tax=Thiohalocapsa halophila TaxID=69359 RepID=A0ABS1CHL8_9GAMM|nr:error-prone DNA polymerase [Thiohalocapsa halophila]MBK1630984.1 error-prone DNA polymerase [Thiohalocapsa halophila]
MVAAVSFQYAELYCRSCFSFLSAASQPQELVRTAARLGYRALAITDLCSLAGVVRAHEEARSLGLKLLIGSELWLEDGPRLVVLAADLAGYRNLSRLISRARRRAPKGQWQLLAQDLDEGLDGCLILWLPDPDAPTDGQEEWGHRLAARFAARCWIGVGLHRTGDDAARLERLRRLGARTGLPLTAVGGVLMHVAERRALLDVMAAIRNGTLVADGAAERQNREQYLRPLDVLARFYPRDLLAETTRIAERCAFTLDAIRYEYPQELVPAGETPSSHLRKLTEEGAAQRFPQGVPEQVRGQIDHELGLIEALAYAPFFLTVHDIVRFARSRGILCQGRGSAANSAVCYCLGITEVDPARMDMLFERFVSRERGEPPDIDVDFEHQRREEVIQYVYAKYGRDRAALAATVIAYRPKSAVRDVGKALGFSQDQVDRLARNINWWDGQQVPPERLREVGLDPYNPQILTLMRLVHELVGMPRHLSQHVGGFVIARRRLDELVPIENAAMDGRSVIQWDKDDLHALGLLKVDCLALGMLSAIRRGLALVNGYRGRALTVADIPPEDPDVYAMIQRGETTGVFQIESRAQMAMLPRLKPACFYDLVIEVAIVRPGPIQGDMVHPYLRRRQRLEPVTYPSPAVEAVLGRTLGVPIFQEQVIQVAMVAAGFDAGEADQVRRSMAAWRRRGGLEHIRGRLIDGMVQRGYTRAFAEQIYKQILGFGEYGFPESHAASFALLVYVSAWLKHHEPAAFFAALINSQPMGFYAPAQLVREARRQGVEVRAVDVRHSHWDCTLEHRTPRRGQPALRLGLRLVKGLSQAGAERLVAARTDPGWQTLDELRAQARLGKRDLKALAGADALAGLAGNRHQAGWRVARQDVVAGTPLPQPGAQASLALPPPAEPALPLLPKPTEGRDIVADYASLGLSLRRHPLALLRQRLTDLGLGSAQDLEAADPGQQVRTAGLVINRQRPASANNVTFVTLEDETGQVNLVVWKQLAERQRRTLIGARLMGVQGEIQREAGVTHLVAKQLMDYSQLLGGLVITSRDFH